MLLNDAVGTLAGGRYEDEDVMMGIIIGTGTNACYVEKRVNIRHVQLPTSAHSEQMLINTEWGSFFSDTLPVRPTCRLYVASRHIHEYVCSHACKVYVAACVAIRPQAMCWNLNCMRVRWAIGREGMLAATADSFRIVSGMMSA